MRVGRFILALLMVAAGIMAFMINLGYGSWASFGLIGKWWPVLLIIFGLAMFWQGRIPRPLAYILVVVIAGGIVGYMMVNDEVWPVNWQGQLPNHTENLDISKNQHPNLQKGELTVNFGGGELDISQAAEGQWMAGTLAGKLGVKSVEAIDDTLKVYLKLKENDWAAQVSDSRPRWELKLAPNLRWQIDANIGAVDANMDLSNINLEELDCDLGAGALELKLGNNGILTKLDIDGGASSVKIEVPQGTGVKVVKDGALMGDNMDELGWNKDGHTLTSPNYDGAANKVEIDIDMGAGSFEIQPY